MGVKGLKKLLTKQDGSDGESTSQGQHDDHDINGVLTALEDTEEQMCLAVDASGYIISLIIQMMGKDKELRLDIPSDYHKIEEKIEEDLLDIELAFGCNFTFFFD